MKSSRYTLSPVTLALLTAGSASRELIAVFGRSRIEEKLEAEVAWVDSRGKRIEVRTLDGRSRTLRYSQRTQVIYRGRKYPVTNLDSGDFIAIGLERDPSGDLYTRFISVRRSVQERGGFSRRRLERLEGNVTHIDPPRGTFELTATGGRKLVVSLPYNTRTSEEEHFRGLKSGDFVRVEGLFLNQERFELDAFL